MSHRFAFVILIFLLAILAMSPVLLAKGMFMDGLIYSSVAMNLKEGIGDFWHLQFTPTLYAQFHEHPPLAMWLQSRLMHVIGTDFWVDRLYSLLCIFVQGILLSKLAQASIPRGREVSYWPVFFFIFNPLTLWMMPNNLLENTMGIFTLGSTLLALRAYQSKKWYLAFLSGILITAAVYTKGPVGLFPFAFFVFYFLFQASKGDFAILFRCFWIQLLGFLVSFFLPIFLWNDAQQSWRAYWERQVINSLENVSTVSHRFYVLQQTALHLLPMIVLLLLTYYLLKKRAILKKPSLTRTSLFWLGFGLSGIVPMMISMKQREFYILPALPFIILSICIFFQPVLEQIDSILQRISKRTFQLVVLSVGLVGLLVSILQYGKFHRNEVLQSDIEQMSLIIPHHATIGMADCLREDWSLYGYAYRYYHWALELSKNHPCFIHRRNRCGEPNQEFQRSNLSTTEFDLYYNAALNFSNPIP